MTNEDIAFFNNLWLDLKEGKVTDSDALTRMREHTARACAEECERYAEKQNAACIALRCEAARKRDAGEDFGPHLDGSHIAGTKENAAEDCASAIRARFGVE